MKKIKVLSSTLLLFASTAIFAQCDNTNLTAWSANQNPSNKLNVTAASAMGGSSCGLELTVAQQQGGAERHWVQDDSPNEELRYRAAFCVDLNGLEVPSSGPERRLKFHIASCGSPAVNGCFGFDNLMLKLQNVGSIAAPDFQIFGYVRDFNIPSTYKRNVFTADVPDSGPFRLEYDLNIADNNNGYLKMWVNATQESDPTILNLTGLSLPPAQVKGINLVRLGQMGAQDSIAAGQTYYFDEFESRRQTFIGGSCN
jgi:hypothetical protein